MPQGSPHRWWSTQVSSDGREMGKPPPCLPISLPSLAPGLPKSASTSATSDEGSIGESPSAPPIGIAGGRRDLVGEQVGVGVKSLPTREPSKSQVNEALYFRVGEDGVACWVLVYVDDLLAASNSTAMLKELLEATFELCEISPVENYLGLEIVRDRPARKLWLHQQSYVGMLRRRFINEEQTGRRPKTPVSVDAYAEPTFDDEDFQSREEEEYRQKTSQRIKRVTLSSTESEYIVASEAGKEARRLQFLLAEFQLLDVGTPTILNMDNQSAITAAEGLGLKGNLKHMEQRYAWLQQMVKRKKIALEYIPTSEQPADFLTKALHFPAFNRCSVAVGQVRLANIGDDDDVQQ
ncbi:unnamed protein product [Closterium sp. NIES-53]